MQPPRAGMLCMFVRHHLPSFSVVIVVIVVPFFRLVLAAIASLIAASLHQPCLRFLSWSERAWCAIQFQACVVFPPIGCSAAQLQAAAAALLPGHRAFPRRACWMLEIRM